ncbi:hypothetical protein D3C73_1596990 [compost metagenome]
MNASVGDGLAPLANTTNLNKEIIPAEALISKLTMEHFVSDINGLVNAKAKRLIRRTY